MLLPFADLWSECNKSHARLVCSHETVFRHLQLSCYSCAYGLCDAPQSNRAARSGVHRHRLRLMYDMPWPMVQSEGQLADMQTIPVPPQRTGRPPGLLENAKWHRKLKHAYGGTNRVAGGSCAHTHTLDEY